MTPDHRIPHARETDMTASLATGTATHTPTDPARRTALVAGAFYLVTFAASIPALLLLGPILHNPDYVVSAGDDTRVLWGCLLDVVNALACIGTAVTLFPVVKRQNQGFALGFVTSRMLEAAIIVIGVVSLLAVVTLRQQYAADHADPAALVTTGHALVAVRDWTFLLGPGLMPALNALLLGTLLYRSRLVPRPIPVLGLVGAPLLVAADAAVFFGYLDQVSAWAGVATLPVAAWELSVGAWMLVKGFRPPAVAALPADA
jgi:hypothetical protein